MVELRRVVRVVIPPSGGGSGGVNGHAGVPAMEGLGRFYEVEVACRGEPDPRTGYLVNIKDVDRAVRGEAPLLARGCAEGWSQARTASALLDAVAIPLGVELRSLTLRTSPYHAVEMSADERTVALIRQRFEFSAAHRLHTAELSDEENRRVFGKCNNPSGHGHNYELETCVAVPPEGGATGAAIERVVHDTVVRRFDHTHLNLDTDEFRELNPTVENIARVVHGLLAPALRDGGLGELRSVRVWESPRTSATYPG